MKNILLFTLLQLMLLSSCASISTSAEVPTMTPVDTGLTAVETVNTFYTLINDAQTEDDLTVPWNMLTLAAQCNPREQCNLFKFQEKRWPNKVLYKLYDCGSNRVVAEEMQYPRDVDMSAAGDAQYWKYQLTEVEGVLLISDIRKTPTPDDNCMLVVN